MQLPQVANDNYIINLLRNGLLLRLTLTDGVSTQSAGRHLRWLQLHLHLAESCCQTLCVQEQEQCTRDGN